MGPVIVVSLLRVSGVFLLVVGILFLIQSVFTHTFSLWIDLLSINFIIIGAVALCLAQGLAKREKWAWYSGVVFFALSILRGLFDIFFSQSLLNIISLLLPILFVTLLIIGRKLYLEEPREKISQWFHKPCFTIVVAGTIISYLVAGSFLVYRSYFMPKMELPLEGIKMIVTRDDCINATCFFPLLMDLFQPVPTALDGLALNEGI